MYDSEENKNYGKLRMQNAISTETLPVQMCEKKSNQINPQVHFVNNPMPTRSNLSGPQEMILTWIIRLN